MKARIALAAFAWTALLALVLVSAWASGQIGIVEAIRALGSQPAQGTNPWFVATLFDAYFGFLWFWLWIAWRETAWTTRTLWLVLILGLGNIAMAVYVLIALRRLPRGAGIDGLFARAR